MSPRLLVSCFPGHGHLHPLLPLTTACREAGWEVLVTTGPDVVPVARRHGLAAVATGLSLAATEARLLAARPDIGSLPQAERMQAVLPAMFVDVAARSRTRELTELLDRWRPDLVLHDITEFAAPIAAMGAGIPRIAHGVSLVGPSPSLMTALRPAVDRLAAEHGVDDGAGRLCVAPYLDICPPSLQSPEASAFDPVVPARPQAAVAVAGERLPAALGALPFPRTVHVTLGTVVNNAPGLLETVLADLVDQPVNLVVTVGPDRDPAGLGRLPRSVVATRYASHALLLPRCSAVVCHAGAGTLLAALAHGLPTVLLPVGAEQARNAELAAATGAALAVPAESATPELVDTAMRQVLDVPAFAAAAQAVAAEIAVMPAAETLVETLRELAAGSPSLR